MATIVTGAAGFVGFHVARALLARGDAVVGVDSLNAYYDVRLKQARLNLLLTTPGFSFHQVDLSDRDATFAVGFGVADPADVVLEISPGFDYDSALFASDGALAAVAPPAAEPPP